MSNATLSADVTAPNAQRLLWAGFLAILATGIGFAIRGGILATWAAQFGFTGAQLGAIGGAGLTGFCFGVIIGGLVVDKIGYGKLIVAAFVMHLLSAFVTFAATEGQAQDTAYMFLYLGTFIFSLANGTLEAVANPLVSTLFPRNRTHYLNILHASWPAGLVIGGLIGWILGEGMQVSWKIQLGLFLVPTVLYGVAFLGQKFPKSEASIKGLHRQGLGTYTEDEARFFFGRENDQRVIISNLFASRLTILYGSSGVGKSSVLRAGVIRELRDRAEAEPDIAVVYLNDWKGDALSLLKQRINDTLLALGHAPPPAPANRTLRESLRHSSQTFDGDVMIILDQFEEDLLYHQRDVSPGSFAYEFADAANDAGLPVSFMVSMRDDALSRLDRFKSLIPNLFSNYLRIRHLTREQAQSAITRPIEAYNRLPESHRSHPGTMAIEPLLIGKILDEVRQDRVLIGESGRGVVSGAESEGIETPCTCSSC